MIQDGVETNGARDTKIQSIMIPLHIQSCITLLQIILIQRPRDKNFTIIKHTRTLLKYSHLMLTHYKFLEDIEISKIIYLLDAFCRSLYVLKPCLHSPIPQLPSCNLSKHKKWEELIIYMGDNERMQRITRQPHQIFHIFSAIFLRITRRRDLKHWTKPCRTGLFHRLGDMPIYRWRLH